MSNTIINKKSAILLGFILVNISVWAWLPNQLISDNPKPYNYTAIDSNYRFIRYKSNKIQQENQSALSSFFNKLDSLRTNKISKVNILHIGDSHIQADLMTDKLRYYFQKDSAFGNGGYGLAYPYVLAKTNNPTFYTSNATGIWSHCRMNSPNKKCDWGLSGIDATTTDINATFSVNLCAFKSRCYDFNNIKIYCNTQDSSLFNIHISTTGNNNDSLIYTLKKDTINNFIEFRLIKAISNIKISFSNTSKSQTSFTLKGLILSNTENSGIVYNSIGLNSATANTFLRNENYLSQTSQVKPDLIIISLGTNDAYGKYLNQVTFKANFSQLILKLKEINPNASIILTSPADSYRKRRYPNINFTITPKILKGIAEEFNCGFWDLHFTMGGYRSINKWYIKKLCQNDKLHFNRKGYELQADLLYDALMKAYSSK